METENAERQEEGSALRQAESMLSSSSYSSLRSRQSEQILRQNSQVNPENADKSDDENIQFINPIPEETEIRELSQVLDIEAPPNPDPEVSNLNPEVSNLNPDTSNPELNRSEEIQEVFENLESLINAEKILEVLDDSSEIQEIFEKMNLTGKRQIAFCFRIILDLVKDGKVQCQQDEFYGNNFVTKVI